MSSSVAAPRNTRLTLAEVQALFEQWHGEPAPTPEDQQAPAMLGLRTVLEAEPDRPGLHPLPALPAEPSLRSGRTLAEIGPRFQRRKAPAPLPASARETALRLRPRQSKPPPYSTCSKTTRLGELGPPPAPPAAPAPRTPRAPGRIVPSHWPAACGAPPPVRNIAGVAVADATECGAMGEVFTVRARVDLNDPSLLTFDDPMPAWKCGAGVGLEFDRGDGKAPIDHRQGPKGPGLPHLGVPNALYESWVETLSNACAARIVHIEAMARTVTLDPPPAGMAGQVVWVTPDDRPPIQDALCAVRDFMVAKALPTGEVHLPAGLYQLGVSWARPEDNQPLMVPSGIALTGDGKGVTTLRIAPEVTQDVLDPRLTEPEAAPYAGFASGWCVAVMNELASSLPYNSVYPYGYVHPGNIAHPYGNPPAGAPQPGGNPTVVRDQYITISNLTIDCNRDNQSLMYTGGGNADLWEGGGADSLGIALVVTQGKAWYPDPPPADLKNPANWKSWSSQLLSGNYHFAVAITRKDAPADESTVAIYSDEEVQHVNAFDGVGLILAKLPFDIADLGSVYVYVQNGDELDKAVNSGALKLKVDRANDQQSPLFYRKYAASSIMPCGEGIYFHVAEQKPIPNNGEEFWLPPGLGVTGPAIAGSNAWYGILLENASDCTISDVEVKGAGIVDIALAQYNSKSDAFPSGGTVERITLQDCDIEDCNYGIVVMGVADAITTERCLVTNIRTVGFYLDDTLQAGMQSNITLQACTFWDCGTGLLTSYHSDRPTALSVRVWGLGVFHCWFLENGRHVNLGRPGDATIKDSAFTWSARDAIRVNEDYTSLGLLHCYFIENNASPFDRPTFYGRNPTSSLRELAQVSLPLTSTFFIECCLFVDNSNLPTKSCASCTSWIFAYARSFVESNVPGALPPPMTLYSKYRGCIFLFWSADYVLPDHAPWSIQHNTFDSRRPEASTFVLVGEELPPFLIDSAFVGNAPSSLAGKQKDYLYYLGQWTGMQQGSFQAFAAGPAGGVAGPCNINIVPSQVPNQPRFPVPLYLQPGDPARSGVAERGAQAAIGLPGPVAPLQERIARLSVLRTKL